MCITDAAKTLQVRPKDLFQFLSSNGWIYRRPGCKNWIAYQHRLKQGVLTHKVTSVSTSDGVEKNQGAGPCHTKGPDDVGQNDGRSK